MELKKRRSEDQIPQVATADVKPIIEEPREVIPGIPPRSVVHHQAKPIVRGFKKGKIFVFFAAAILLLSGATWAIVHRELDLPLPQHDPSTAVTMPTQVVQPTEKQTITLQPSADTTVKQNKQSQPSQKPETIAKNQATQFVSPKEEEVVPPRKTEIIRHRVEQGETLYRISLKYYKTGRYGDYLARYNKLGSAQELISGNWIKVPYPPEE